MRNLNVFFPPKLHDFIRARKRYKVLHGGRGSGKSVSFAQDLIIKAAFENKRILCTREIQNSIKDSVHRLLCDTIDKLELQSFFNITRDGITGVSGSEIIYKGLRSNISEIKSLEGVDIVWIEEAEKVSEESFKILIPTIRKENSEIWISFNPEDENSPVYQRFVVNPPPDALVVEINFPDNPFFPEVLLREMEYCKQVDYEAYEHIWMGQIKKYADALIFKGKVRIDSFETDSDVERFFFGLDFGYAQDPLAIGRMYIKDNTLFIDYESAGVGVENEEIEVMLDSVPGSRQWEIVADSARPELISYIQRKGFNIIGADKGKGSVEDGIQFLRSFKEIVIHERCKRAKEDFLNYKWKTDRQTGEVLPIPIGTFDHFPDLTRYALQSYIKQRNAAAYTLAYDVSPE